jgi:hypothetical protein
MTEVRLILQEGRDAKACKQAKIDIGIVSNPYFRRSGRADADRLGPGTRRSMPPNASKQAQFGGAQRHRVSVCRLVM